MQADNIILTNNIYVLFVKIIDFMLITDIAKLSSTYPFKNISRRKQKYQACDTKFKLKIR